MLRRKTGLTLVPVLGTAAVANPWDNGKVQKSLLRQND